MATHSSVLAWRIPGMGEPGGLPSVGLHRVGYDWSDLAAAAARSLWASQVALVVKNLPASAGDVRDSGSIPGSGTSPGGGQGNPLQYSYVENPMDRGAWRATVHRVAQSRTWLMWLSMHAFEEELRPVVNLTYQHGPSSHLTGMILAVVTAVDILWNLMFRFYFISSRKIIAEDFRKFFAVSGARNEVKGFSSYWAYVAFSPISLEIDTHPGVCVFFFFNIYLFGRARF